MDARTGGTITPYDDRHVLVAGGIVDQPSFIADLVERKHRRRCTTTQDIGVPQREFATATAYVWPAS